MKEKMRNSLLRNGSSPLLSESVDSSEPGSSLKETLSVRNIDLNSSNALSSSMNPISEKAAKIAHVAPTYTPSSSKKVIGSLYLPASEIMLVKTSLCEPLFITLDIKEFHVSGDGSPAPDGFSWEQMQEDPIMEQLNGKEGIKLATVPSIAYNLASSGFTTDHSFLSDFLRTYRYFANSVDISRLLIMMYIQAKDIAFAKADSEEVKNMKMNVDDMATHIKLRILNIFKKWLSDQPQDFEEEPLICGILTSFLSTHVSFDPKRAPFAQTMMEQLATITASSPIMNRRESDALSLPRVISNGGARRASVKPQPDDDGVGYRRTSRRPTSKVSSPESDAGDEKTSVTRRRTTETTTETCDDNENEDDDDDDFLPPIPIQQMAGAKSPRVFRYRKSVDATANGSFPVPPQEPGLETSRRASMLSLNPDDFAKYAMNDGSGKSNRRRDSEIKQESVDSQLRIVKDASNQNATAGLRPLIDADEYPRQSLPNESSWSQCSLLDIDGEGLGQQLGLIEQKLFKSIPLHDFFCQNWNDKTNPKSLGLKKLINWFNHVARGVACEVVRQEDTKLRVMVVKKLITTAQDCLRYSNYNTCFEIVAGLNMSAISRLKRTWKALPKKYLETWEYLNQIVSNESSYRAYRQTMRDVKEKFGEIPVLPYVGVNLSDLTFTEDGNPSFYENPNATKELGDPPLPLVNFGKMRLISQVFSMIKEQQRSPNFQFDVNLQIQFWILEVWPLISENDLYAASLKCEPRAAV
ncbi:MAG: hypothetical protein SGCHY_004374 [Lobulomycetales sp.]